MSTECFVCYLDECVVHPSNSEKVTVQCKRCGEYQVAPSTIDILRRIPANDRPKISEWIYQSNRQGESPEISADTIHSISGRRMLTFGERRVRLLLYLAEESQYTPGQPMDITNPKIQAIILSYNLRMVAHIVVNLRNAGFVQSIPPGRIVLTTTGITEAERLNRANTISTQGFVAMWRDPAMESAWLIGIEPVIREAGYTAQRMDKRKHTNTICDEMITEIRKSRFIVADFTGQRRDVYFVAGYANGYELPVIWTCRKDEVNNLDFDIHQYNVITWETPEELGQRLKSRLVASFK